LRTGLKKPEIVASVPKPSLPFAALAMSGVAKKAIESTIRAELLLQLAMTSP
jgi:hypothetical protein